MTKNALILREEQWNDLLKWIPNTEQAEQDERILSYLQEASAAMKAKWPENNRKREAKKPPKSSNPEIARYEAIKNADEAKRRSLIEEAERFVSARNIKECPIDLRSAAILSENLAGRKIQLEFQAVQKAEEREKTLQRNRLDMAQSVAWLSDGFAHRTNAHQVALQHKKELLDSIVERKRLKDEAKAKRIAEEKAIIEACFKDVADRKVQDRKRREEQIEYMRKHELETVLMAKQKREHIKRENEVIGVLAKVHHEGRHNIKELIKSQESQAKLERAKLAAKLYDKGRERHIAEIEQLKEEQQMIARARVGKEKILDQLEEKAKDKKKFLKDDRMQDYEQSLKAAAEKRVVAQEEDKEYFRNRIMNDVVSLEYRLMKKQQKDKRTMENLAEVKKQAKELRIQLRDEITEDQRIFNKKFEDDTTDQKFFEFAQDLMDDAEAKNRPLKPITQVTKHYKNRHFIDIVKKTRPHEISNVPIEEELVKPESDKGKSKRRLKYERDEKRMANVYRSTKFINVD